MPFCCGSSQRRRHRFEPAGEGVRDELLLQPIAADQCRELATGKNEPIARPQQELLRDLAQGAKPGDQGTLQRAGCGRGLAGSRQMPAQQLAGVAVDE
jgi:hypothetical protein